MESQQMSIHALLKDELVYEVSIRSWAPKSTVVELKKQLQTLLETIPAEAVSETDFTAEEELRVVRSKVEDLVAEAERFERSKERHALYRARSLGWHLRHRVARIHTTELKLATEKSSLEIKVNEVLGKLVTRSQEANTTEEPQKSVECSGDRNVLKWNVKFNGSSDPISFIERVLEMQQATGISDGKLFRSSALLFIDLGKIWFNGVKDTVNSWDELKELLLEEFLPQDYDYQLMNEIRGRLQGAEEPSHIYLAVMANLFARLKRPLPESDQLEILRHNIRRDFIKQLALVEVSTVAGLKEKCRLIESSCQQKSLFTDFNCRSKQKQVAAVYQNKFSKNSNRDAGQMSRTPTCFKCGLTNHDFRSCKGKEKGSQMGSSNIKKSTQPICCYGCGEIGYTIRSCLKCKGDKNPKNL